jgi:hypothetical protein
MARGMIGSPHTKEECLSALDEALGKGKDTQGKFDFGCKVGDHTAFALVDVNSRNEALNLVLTFLQSKALIVVPTKFDRSCMCNDTRLVAPVRKNVIF